MPQRMVTTTAKYNLTHENNTLAPPGDFLDLACTLRCHLESLTSEGQLDSGLYWLLTKKHMKKKTLVAPRPAVL